MSVSSVVQSLRDGLMSLLTHFGERRNEDVCEARSIECDFQNFIIYLSFFYPGEHDPDYSHASIVISLSDAVEDGTELEDFEYLIRNVVEPIADDISDFRCYRYGDDLNAEFYLIETDSNRRLHEESFLLDFAEKFNDVDL